jgi:hypothetical protein
MRFIVVELDDGTQEFFDRSSDAFRYAKQHEDKRRHSVDYVAIGEFYDDDGVVFRGQNLRMMLRATDNVVGWIRHGSNPL